MTKYAKSIACMLGAGTALAVLGKAKARARRRSLQGQVVWITGGSRGFGLALARELASLGCRIALCARDEEELARAQQSLAAEGHEVFVMPCDIASPESIAAAVDAITRQYGRIDILVNNAGEIMVSPLENLQPADFERAMAVMFWGIVHATLAVLPAMKARGHGRIVNITSIGGKVSVPHLLGYSCAKAAAVAFSDGLRSEVRRFGVDVLTIVPGLMRTGSHVNALFKGSKADESAWFGAAASMPLLSMSAKRAARLAVDAICTGRPQRTLGLAANILSRADAILPGLTSQALSLCNSLLPVGNGDNSAVAGRDLEDQHGSVYRVLTTLGRRAGRQLNQPV
jgi:short-subunit dehydrogenase